MDKNFRYLTAKWINNLEKKHAGTISFDDVANAVYAELDPANAAIDEIRYLAVMQLKEFARVELQKKTQSGNRGCSQWGNDDG